LIENNKIKVVFNKIAFIFILIIILDKMTKTNKTEKNVLEELENINEKSVKKLFKSYINIIKHVVFSNYLKENWVDEDEILKRLNQEEYNKVNLADMFKDLEILWKAKEIIIVNNIPSILYPELLNLQEREVSFNNNITNKYAKIFKKSKEDDIQIHIVNMPMNTEEVHISELTATDEKSENEVARVTIEQIIQLIGDIIKWQSFVNDKGEKVNSPIKLEDGTLVLFNDFVIIEDIINKVVDLTKKGIFKETKINLWKELEKHKEDILPVLYAWFITDKWLFYRKLNSWINMEKVVK